MATIAQELLGYLLRESDSQEAKEVFTKLKEEFPKHDEIPGLDAVCKAVYELLYADSRPISLATLNARTGGIYHDQIQEVLRAGSKDTIEEIIRERDRANLLVALGEATAAIASGGAPSATADHLGGSLRALAARRSKSIGWRDYISDARREYQAVLARGAELKTGIRALDDKFMFRRRQMSIVAAPTSHGKTAFATMLANQAEHSGLSVAMLCFEDYTTLPLKMASQRYKRNLSWYTRYDLATEPQRCMVDESLVELQEVSRINVHPPCPISTFAASCRKQKPDLVILDYAQRYVECYGGENKREACGKIASDFQSLTQELGAIGVLCSQVRRRELSNNGTPRRPQLGDLKESGDLENYADAVLLLWWPWKDVLDDNDMDKGRYHIEIAKDKLGECGDLKVRFDPTTLSWKDEYQAAMAK